MDIKEYIQESSRTMDKDNINPHRVKTETIHGIIGICTESGELLDIVKKSLFYNKELDSVNLREEIGDLLWYIAAVARSENLDLEKIMEENILKLKIRYPDKFTFEHAKMRLDKEEN